MAHLHQAPANPTTLCFALTDYILFALHATQEGELHLPAEKLSSKKHTFSIRKNTLSIMGAKGKTCSIEEKIASQGWVRGASFLKREAREACKLQTSSFRRSAQHAKLPSFRFPARRKTPEAREASDFRLQAKREAPEAREASDIQLQAQHEAREASGFRLQAKRQARESFKLQAQREARGAADFRRSAK